jgi:hypothetical protein
MDTANDHPEKPSYVSDTGRSWGAPISGFGRVETTDDLIAALETGDCERYCLLVHPGRWSRSPAEQLQRVAWDLAAETAKAAAKTAHRLARSGLSSRQTDSGSNSKSNPDQNPNDCAERRPASTVAPGAERSDEAERRRNRR